MSAESLDRSASAAAAAERLERNLTRFQSVARAAALAAAVLDVGSLRPTYRWPRLISAGVAAAVAHGAWASTRLVRRGNSDPVVARTELPVAMALLVADAVAGGPGTPVSGPRPGMDYAATALMLRSIEAAKLSEMVPEVALMISGVVAAIPRGRDSHVGGRLAAAVGVGQGLAGFALVAALRSQAQAVDRLNGDSAVAVAAAAEAQERRRQHRLIHDSVLQTLELIAGRWPTDETLLATAIEDDMARLRALLESEPAVGPVSVLEVLAEVTYRGALRGLHVEVVDEASEDRVAAHVAESLREACLEAITNVSRHAGVDRAEIRVSGGAGELTVTVVDRGCGFDPSRPTTGFGLRESICGRLAEAGVDCRIVSAPGVGTTIIMRTRTEG